ncbi:aldo/keto reductase [Candidatus Marinimicrobia bacterium MT.SAG.2]|nr:aldo/keto reductase [Candidatus Marinimicrobia bacterium MT.SAG.2]
MEYTKLGRSGLTVSRLCLGTMNFGPYADEKESHEIMDKALELGINFFDTADVYGWEMGEGLTEKIIGSWLSKDNGRRESIVLATKVYGQMGNAPNERGLSKYHIISACEESLTRLQTDRIDLYQMHHVERTTPYEEIWEAMEQLVREGKVLYVGSSNFAGWDIAKAQGDANKRNFMGLISEQHKYSLSCRLPELEVLPSSFDHGIGVIPWSPLDGGILGGKALDPEKKSRSIDKMQKTKIEKYRSNIEQYYAFCEELGESPADVAIAWLLQNEAVSAPIIGPRNEEQLVGITKSVEIKLSVETLKKLDEIWPGPGGSAPEAYSW